MPPKLIVIALLLTLLVAPLTAQTARARPNILWITCEDTSPLLPAIAQASLVDPQHKDASNYIARMVEYLPGQIGK